MLKFAATLWTSSWSSSRSIRVNTLRAVSTSSTSTVFVGILAISFEPGSKPAAFRASSTPVIAAGSLTISHWSSASLTSSAPASRASSMIRSSSQAAAGSRIMPFRSKR